MSIVLQRIDHEHGFPTWEATDPLPLQAHLSWNDEPPSQVKVWLRVGSPTNASRQLDMPMFTIAGGFYFMDLASVSEYMADHIESLSANVGHNVSLILDDIMFLGMQITLAKMTSDAPLPEATQSVVDQIKELLDSTGSEDDDQLTEDEEHALRVIEQLLAHTRENWVSEWDVNSALDDYFDDDQSHAWDNNEDSPAEYLLMQLHQMALIQYNSDGTELALTVDGHAYLDNLFENDQRYAELKLTAPVQAILWIIRNIIISIGDEDALVYESLEDKLVTHEDGEDTLDTLFAMHALIVLDNEKVAVTRFGEFALTMEIK